MTQTEPIEERLRRTFGAVAKQPIAPARFDISPGQPRSHAAMRHRTPRAWAAGAVAAVVIIGVILAVAYGPRSATNPSIPPGTGQEQALRGVFVPTVPSSSTQLREAARTMTARLHALGDTGATTSLQAGRLEVRGSPVTQADLGLAASGGHFLVRPIECGAPAPAPGAAAEGSSPIPASSLLPVCGAAYRITAGDLTTVPGSPFITTPVPPDPALAAYSSTAPADDVAGATVLLPTDDSSAKNEDARYVLGPAELTQSDIAHAVARGNGGLSDGRIWTVDLTLTPEGSVLWDQAASKSFHAMIGIDLDGTVISAPLIQPSNTTFVSFGGQLQMSGNFTATQAKGIAAVLDNGTMPVTLKESATPGT